MTQQANQPHPPKTAGLEAKADAIPDQALEQISGGTDGTEAQVQGTLSTMVSQVIKGLGEGISKAGRD